MAHAHDPRCIEVPGPIRQRVSSLVAEHGIRAAAERLGVSRNAVLGVMATGYCMRGTLALLERSGASAG